MRLRQQDYEFEDIGYSLGYVVKSRPVFINAFKMGRWESKNGSGGGKGNVMFMI